MKIGDKVRVCNVNLDTHGRTGRLVGYGHEDGIVRVGIVRVEIGGMIRVYYKRSLQVVDETTTKRDDYHVAIVTCVDGEIGIDFSNNPSIKTMEDDFDLVCESEIIIGFLDDIKVDIMNRLNSWDNVVGLINNKPFKVSRSLVFEGVDL